MTTIASACALTAVLAVMLLASGRLVAHLEALGNRAQLTEAALGLLAALAADSPEITSAITALVRHQPDIGTGVILGSNVFNLAALLGLAVVVARRMDVHRRVVVLEGVPALWSAVWAMLVLRRLVEPAVGLGLLAVVLVPYVVASVVPRRRLLAVRLPRRLATILVRAIGEAEEELEPALYLRSGSLTDAGWAGALLLVVLASSIAAETLASRLGTRFGLSDAIVGAIVLAFVTSLPNAVAAIYLARRGRGAALLSEALNSNTVNIAVGLFLPAVVIGLGASRSSGSWTSLYYLGFLLATLTLVFVTRGLKRSRALGVCLCYLVFVVLVVV